MGLLSKNTGKIGVEVWQDGGSDDAALGLEDYGGGASAELQILSGYWLPATRYLPPPPPSLCFTARTALSPSYIPPPVLVLVTLDLDAKEHAYGVEWNGYPAEPCGGSIRLLFPLFCFRQSME